MTNLDRAAVHEAYANAREKLLSEWRAEGCWRGELSTSATLAEVSILPFTRTTPLLPPSTTAPDTPPTERASITPDMLTT